MCLFVDWGFFSGGVYLNIGIRFALYPARTASVRCPDWFVYLSMPHTKNFHFLNSLVNPKRVIKILRDFLHYIRQCFIVEKQEIQCWKPEFAPSGCWYLGRFGIGFYPPLILPPVPCDRCASRRSTSWTLLAPNSASRCSTTTAVRHWRVPRVPIVTPPCSPLSFLYHHSLEANFHLNHRPLYNPIAQDL